MSDDSSGYGLSDVAASASIDAPDLSYLPTMPKQYRPNIGLIGCGGVSEYHLRAYRTLGLTVVALCNRDIRKAESRRDEYFPNADVYSDYRDVCTRDDIEIIDATTHPPERIEIIESALRAGKHVLSQKPYVFDMTEGQRLVQIARQQERLLAVNQNGRWAPHFSYMRQAVDAGLIGRVSSVNFSLQWNHTWIAGTPFDELKHLILMDFGVHWFDMCTVLFGERKPISVSAQVARMARQRTRAPMLAHVIVEYPDGQATMSFNGHVLHGQKDQTVVTGELGTLRSTGPSLSEQSVALYTEAGTAVPTLEGTWFDNGFQGAMTELLCAIEEQREPCHSAHNNLDSLALCFAALASADDGGQAKLPGQYNTFSKGALVY